MMDRRRFLVTSVAGALAAPLVAEAQQTGRQVTIGVLCTGVCPFPVPPEPSRALIIALERIGLTQGSTLRWDIGGIVNTEDQIAVEAQKLVSRHPDLILVLPGSVAAARAANLENSRKMKREEGLREVVWVNPTTFGYEATVKSPAACR